MKKLVYLTSLDAYARHEGQELVISSAGQQKRLTWQEIQRIVLVGKPRLSTAAGFQAMFRDIPVNYLSLLGNKIGCFGRFYHYREPRAMLCEDGITWDEFRLQFIRKIAMAKIHNQRILLKQQNLDEDQLKEIEYSIRECSNENVIRGKEGAAAAIYWKAYASLVSPFRFDKRTYYPPQGEVNTMLSLGYSLLHTRIAEALISARISPYEGIFHAPGGNHFALASDLIESFRFLVDRMVLTLIHRGQIKPQNFYCQEKYNTQLFRLSSTAMKIYVFQFETTMQNDILYQGASHNWAEIINDCAQNLKRCLTLGIEYKPYRLD